MEKTESLVISESCESTWSFHLSKGESPKKALCGLSVRPTSIEGAKWDDVGTVFELPCQACQVLNFGWPEDLVFEDHPLFVACRILMVYDGEEGIQRLQNGIEDGSNPELMMAAIVLIHRATQMGSPNSIAIAKRWWSQKFGKHKDLTASEEQRLARIFHDLHFSWRKRG